MVWGFAEEMYLIIGDIHGCSKTLNKLLDEAFGKYHIEEIFILGDMIDRGSFSREVLETVTTLQAKTQTTLFLGNHEDMFLDFVLDSKRYCSDIWFHNGGKATIKSFQKDVLSKSLSDIRSFCKENILERFSSIFGSLEIFKTLSSVNKKYLLSHAGGFYGDKLPEELYNLLRADDKSTFQPFIWDREIDFETEKYHDFRIIHGHTPTKSIPHQDPDKPYVNKHVSINIDTSCVYGYSLSSVFIDSEGNLEFLSVKCVD